MHYGCKGEGEERAQSQEDIVLQNQRLLDAQQPLNTLEYMNRCVCVCVCVCTCVCMCVCVCVCVCVEALGIAILKWADHFT